MSRKGFTLVELMMVVVIIVALGVFTFINYSGKSSSLTMNSAAQEVATLLREAQSRTLAGDGNNATTTGFWAVEFANPTGTAPFFSLLFETSTGQLASGTDAEGQTRLPPSIAYTTSTVAAGGAAYVYFTNGAPGMPPGAYESCSGFTCPTGTTTIMIGLYTPNDTPMLSSTISIAPTGNVSY